MKNENIKVVVVGGGFAGIRLIRTLRRHSSGIKITLVDPEKDAVFRPLLPDVIAGKVEADRLRFPLEAFCRRENVEYLNAAATGLAEGSLLLGDARNLEFDFLAICCGATPNFYGNDQARAVAFTLYGRQDALRLRRRIEEIEASGREHSFLIIGGGYTGVETATAIRYHLRKRSAGGARPRISIHIIELGSRILAGLPDEIAGPAREEVRRLGIRASTSARLGQISPDRVEVDGASVHGFSLIWSAGVRTGEFVQNLNFPKDRQGRIVVNPDLRVPGTDAVFALGDAAAFPADGGTLRMAVQFSRAEGKAAALNILRLITGQPARPYRPRDLGYLIPLASWKAWGKALGTTIGGRPGSFLHYFMCLRQTHSPSNRFRIVSDLARNALVGLSDSKETKQKWNGGCLR